MTRRITVAVSDELYAALVAEAKRDFRDLAGQVRYKLALPTSSATLLLEHPTAAQSHPTAAQVDSTLLVDEPSPEQDVEDMLLAADEMDDSGELMRKSSPAAKRRRAQIEALQRAWGELFPNLPPLTEGSAKDWLVLTDNAAAQVYFAMQKATSAQHPVSYVRGILKNEREDAIKLRKVEDAPVTVTVHQGDHDGWKWHTPTEAEKEENRVVQRWAWEHGRPGTDDPEVWTEAKLRELYPNGDIPARGSKAA